MYNSVTIEERGKPTVSLCHRDFVSDAKSAAAIKGMPVMRVVSETVPCECSVDKLIDAGVTAVIDDIITAQTSLTYTVLKPLDVSVGYAHIKDDSNISVYEYRKNLYTVNLEYRF